MLARIGKIGLPLAVVAALASACGGTAKAADPKLCIPKGQLKQFVLPAVLGGLSVTPDTAATKKLKKAAADPAHQTYMCDASVFALRQGTELKAVFTVERLANDARVEEKDFRTKMVNELTQKTAGKPQKVGDLLVYKAKLGLQQLIRVWFQEGFLEYLVISDDPSFSNAIDVERLSNEAYSLQPTPVVA